MFSIRYADRPYLFIVAQNCIFVNTAGSEIDNFWTFRAKSLDTKLFVLYSKYKLVRFTGVPLISLVECGDFKKQKQRIKTNQCAPGWARISEERR